MIPSLYHIPDIRVLLSLLKENLVVSSSPVHLFTFLICLMTNYEAVICLARRFFYALTYFHRLERSLEYQSRSTKDVEGSHVIACNSGYCIFGLIAWNLVCPPPSHGFAEDQFPPPKTGFEPLIYTCVLEDNGFIGSER